MSLSRGLFLVTLDVSRTDRVFCLVWKNAHPGREVCESLRVMFVLAYPGIITFPADILEDRPLLSTAVVSCYCALFVDDHSETIELKCF